MTGKLISQYLRDNSIKQRWLAEELDISESRMSFLYGAAAAGLYDAGKSGYLKIRNNHEDLD